MRTPEEFARDYFGAARTTTDERAIADRDAEWTAKVEELRAELETAKKRRDSNEQARALTAEARDKYASEANQLRAEVEAARARLGEAERLLREAPPHGGMTAYRDWLAIRDAYVAGISATAAKYNAHLREFDALAKKVTALERVVKRIDTEHAEMCPQHTGLAAPATDSIAPALKAIEEIRIQQKADGRLLRHLGQTGALQSEIVALSAKVAALEEWSRQSYLRDHRLAEPIDWKGCHLCNGLTVGTCHGCDKRICSNHVRHCDTCKAAPTAPPPGRHDCCMRCGLEQKNHCTYDMQPLDHSFVGLCRALTGVNGIRCVLPEGHTEWHRNDRTSWRLAEAVSLAAPPAPVAEPPSGLAIGQRRVWCSIDGSAISGKAFTVIGLNAIRATCKYVDGRTSSDPIGYVTANSELASWPFECAHGLPIDDDRCQQCAAHDLAKSEAAEPPMCYQIDCRHYGQRHATAHEPREPEAAGLVHAFVAGVGSVCWHYHPPKDGLAGFFCHAPPGNPIHATERK